MFLANGKITNAGTNRSENYSSAEDARTRAIFEIFLDIYFICCEAITFGFFDLNLSKLVSPTPLWLHAFGGARAKACNLVYIEYYRALSLPKILLGLKNNFSSVIFYLIILEFALPNLEIKISFIFSTIVLTL